MFGDLVPTDDLADAHADLILAGEPTLVAPGCHWHACAGRNFTDRQRIRRNAESWARRYRAMPPGERLAVLAAVMAVEAEE